MDEFWILNQSIKSLLTGRMGLSTKVGASDEGTKSSPTCSQSNSRSNSLAVHKLKNSVGGGGASPRKSIAASFQTKFSREGNLKITFSEKLIFKNQFKVEIDFLYRYQGRTQSVYGPRNLQWDLQIQSHFNQRQMDILGSNCHLEFLTHSFALHSKFRQL